MTGHISGRKIWAVSDDEDGYMYVDETLKILLSKLLSKREKN